MMALALLSSGAQSQRVIGAPSRFPYAPGVDVRHYDIALTLPVSGTMLRAQATLTVDRMLTIDTLRLDLVDLTIDSVMVNGLRRATVRDSAVLRVPLRKRDGTHLRVRIDYHGSPRDGLIIREDSARGWSAFGDNWPNRARFWIPSIDHPSDKATVTWRVTVPAGRSVIANGTRVSPTRKTSNAEGQTETTQFRMTQPIPTYLMVVGVATMHETSLGRTACGFATGGGCVPQSVWTFAPETPTMPGNFREADRIVSTFAKMLGPFAYARLAHVQSATRFGGMENATAIFYSDRAFRTQTLGVSLIAHETAHQWFGDAVTPRRWADLWLSEGFATYLAAVYTQQTRGDSAFRDEMRRIRNEVLAAPVVAERPVVDSIGAATPVTLLNANSYQKGGFVLHMLRARIGDAAFFGALRDYQQQYRHGTAATDDFRRAAERRSGTGLTAFFNQWLHRPGWADLTVSWTWRAATSTLALQVVQGTRHAPFAMPLTLSIQTDDGRMRTVRVAIAATASQLIMVPVPGVRDVAEMVADPRAELLGTVTLLRAMP
jgi:aminopeptidase N